MQPLWWQTICDLTERLDAASITYCIRGPAGLAVQGVQLDELPELTISVQWDLFQQARALLAGGADVAEGVETAAFRFERGGFPVCISCQFNHVVESDPDRVPVERDGRRVWAQGVLAFRRGAQAGDPLASRINQYLERLQRELARQNGLAWTENPYEAWVNRFGEPEVAADRLVQNPKQRLAALWPYLGEVRGRRVVNLLGSHGSKGVALALLGAQVTVVDISAENARYARELAQAAGVALHYVLADVLDMPPAELTRDYDLALMELGILHYFVDLVPLFRVVHSLLRTNGRLVLQDFHPVSTKLITSKGKKHKVTGNYFDSGLAEVKIAYTGYLDNQAQAPVVRQRKWTLGEVVTAAAEAGLFVRMLQEEPNHKLDDIGLPKTFTLVAQKL